MTRDPAALGLLALAIVLFVRPAAGLAEQPDARRGKDAYARAVALEQEGNHSAALLLLWEAAGHAPGDGEVQQRLGEALERIGALAAAIDAYRRALQARPHSRSSANSLILALVRAGKGPEAVDRARALVAGAPRDPDALFTLGLAQSEQDVEAAVETFRRVLELAPRHTLARYNLALVLKRTDRLRDAADELTRALSIEPRPEAHYTLGVISWHQGDLAGAIRSLRAAIELQPGHADAHYTLGAVLKARGDLTGAVDSLRRAIALRPDLWGAHYTLAQVYQLAGNADAAASQLERAERLRQRAQQEQEAGVWTAVGTGKLDAGDAAGALEHFRRATEAFDAYAPAHYQMGRALLALRRHDEARVAFGRARQLNPALVPPGTP